MSNRSNYLKKFIIFKKDYSNMKELKSKGHGKLEVKGNNLNISLNIKAAEANNFYNVDLIKRSQAYTLGKVYTREDKSGQRDISVNYRELEKNSFLLEDLDGIILSRGSKVLLGESLKGSGRVLKAYIEGLEEILPKEETYPEEIEEIEEEKEEEIVENLEDVQGEISIEYIETPPAIEEVETAVDKEVLAEEPVEEEQVIEEVQEIQDIQDIQEEEPQEISEEGSAADQEEEKEQAEQVESREDPEISEEAQDMFSEKAYEEIMEEIFNIPELGYENHIDLDESDLDHKNKLEADEMSDYVKNILNFFPHSEPFNMVLEGYDWWTIDTAVIDGDKSFLPYFSYIIGGNNKSARFDQSIDPSELLNRYGHYLFGLYNEGERIKFYMYGLPGKFSLEDYPRGGSAGFNTWFEGVEAPGYWVIYIEPETGKILYPINPMIPKV